MPINTPQTFCHPYLASQIMGFKGAELVEKALQDVLDTSHVHFRPFCITFVSATLPETVIFMTPHRFANGDCISIANAVSRNMDYRLDELLPQRKAKREAHRRKPGQQQVAIPQLLRV